MNETKVPNTALQSWPERIFAQAVDPFTEAPLSFGAARVAFGDEKIICFRERCSDEVHKGDVEYIRADLTKQALSEPSAHIILDALQGDEHAMARLRVAAEARAPFEAARRAAEDMIWDVLKEQCGLNHAEAVALADRYIHGFDERVTQWRRNLELPDPPAGDVVK